MQRIHWGDALENLSQRRCRPCEGGAEPLPAHRVESLLPQVPGWSLCDGKRAIGRRFRFRGFAQTIGFVNVLAWIAHGQGHHPDFTAGYDYCDVSFTTHAIGGLSENDFICAARLNDLADD